LPKRKRILALLCAYGCFVFVFHVKFKSNFCLIRAKIAKIGIFDQLLSEVLKYREIMVKNGALEFEEYEEYLRKLFPSVLTLQFEDMKKDVYGFVSKICEFMGIEVPEFNVKPTNVSLTEKQLRLIQFIKSRNISLWGKNKIVGLLIFIFNRGELHMKKKSHDIKE